MPRKKPVLRGYEIERTLGMIYRESQKSLLTPRYKRALKSATLGLEKLRPFFRPQQD